MEITFVTVHPHASSTVIRNPCTILTQPFPVRVQLLSSVPQVAKKDRTFYLTILRISLNGNEYWLPDADALQRKFVVAFEESGNSAIRGTGAILR